MRTKGSLFLNQAYLGYSKEQSEGVLLKAVSRAAEASTMCNNGTDGYPQLQATLNFRFVNCAVDSNGLYLLMHAIAGAFG